MEDKYRNLLYFLVFIIIVISEIFFSDPLYKASNDVILSMEANNTLFGIRFFQIISFLGAGPVYFLIFVIFFNWKARSFSFYYILYISVNMYIVTLGKLVYHAPRPYMTNPDIKVYDCTQEFGNPSGHSMMSPFFLFMTLDLYKYIDHTNKRFYIAITLSISWIILVGFSRLYLGVHSMN